MARDSRMGATVDAGRILAFARDLIAIPTENPPGRAYAECVDRIAAELESCGIAYERVETGEPGTERTCLIGQVGEGPRALYLHGHYDVVPAFSAAQLAPRIADGCLVGRGASDMKGGLAAIIHGAVAAAARGGRVVVVIVPDEETGGRLGAERLAALGQLGRCPAAGAVLAEPTWGTIWHAARGAYTLRVTVRGKPAHVGLHYEGRNAFEDAFATVAALDPLRGELRNRRSRLVFASDHPRAAESILLVGGVASGGTNFNIVPDHFSFTIDRRPNPEEDMASAKAELDSVLAGVRQRGIDIDWETIQDAGSTHTPADSPLVTALAREIRDIAGSAPSVTCCPGVLETRVYGALGIPAVAFGPGLIEAMHAPDERVPVANLAAAAEVYARVGVALTS